MASSEETVRVAKQSKSQRTGLKKIEFSFEEIENAMKAIPNFDSNSYADWSSLVKILYSGNYTKSALKLIVLRLKDFG